MRALLVVSSDRLAGTERHVVDLAMGLRRKGVCAEVACLPGDHALATSLQKGDVPTHPLPIAGLGIVATTVALGRLARDFDLLHSHLTTATVAAVGASLMSGRPVVETRHFVALAYETRGWAGHLAGTALRAALARRVALTLAPSKAAGRRAKGPTLVVPHGIAATGAAPGGRQTGRFVSVGRLDSDRDCALLIRAFAVARPRLPDSATLAFVGDGTERTDLERLCDELGLGNRVQFAGWLDDPTGQLATADVYLAAPFLPVPESFGLSVLEAMRAGLPVVAEPGGGASDLVQPGTTGLLVAPDPVAWAAAMVGLAADPATAKSMGAEGRRRAHHEFSLDAMVARTVEAYHVVVALPAPRTGVRSGSSPTRRVRSRDVQRQSPAPTNPSPL